MVLIRGKKAIDNKLNLELYLNLFDSGDLSKEEFKSAVEDLIGNIEVIKRSLEIILQP